MEKKKKTNPNPNPNPGFGNDLLLDILSRLPAKSLMRFKLVCKRWLSLIKDPHFVNLHFSLSKTRLDETTLLIHPSTIPTYISEHEVGGDPILFSVDLFHGGKVVPFPLTKFGLGGPRYECSMLRPVNGLVCFIGCKGSILIYNPCTGERTSWIENTAPSSTSTSATNITLGFGFDPTTKKHKVICIAEMFTKKTKQTSHRVCEVLIVGENTWKKIDEVPPPYSFNKDEALHVNGVIYWRDNHYPRAKVIVAFDIISEKFRVIQTPDRYNECTRWQSVNLVEVDGRIALLDRRSYHEDICLWIFNDGGGEEDDNWIAEFMESLPFPWNCELRLDILTIEGTNLIILRSFYSPIKRLCLYDRKEKSAVHVDITGKWSTFSTEVTTFVQSLFSVQN